MSQDRVGQVWEKLTADTQDQHKRAGSTVRELAAWLDVITPDFSKLLNLVLSGSITFLRTYQIPKGKCNNLNLFNIN